MEGVNPDEMGGANGDELGAPGGCVSGRKGKPNAKGAWRETGGDTPALGGEEGGGVDERGRVRNGEGGVGVFSLE